MVLSSQIANIWQHLFDIYELLDSNMELCITNTVIEACNDVVAPARSQSCPPSLRTATDEDLHAELAKAADARYAMHCKLTKRQRTSTVDQPVASEVPCETSFDVGAGSAGENAPEEARYVSSVIGMFPCPPFRVNISAPEKSREPPKLVWKPASWRYPARWVWEAPAGSAGVPQNYGNADRNKRRNLKRQ